ncbi:MAG: hypothetical protein C0476_12195 [Sphingomonas sp.]|nr:hypothetical protein [Sphingomonas sp.]
MVNFLVVSVMSAAVALSGIALANEPFTGPKTETNLVKLVIARDGQILGAPSLAMRLGSEAVVRVARPGGYSVKLALGHEPRIVNGRKVEMEVALIADGQPVTIGRPSVSLALNTPGRVSLPDAQGKPVEISVIVEAAPAPTN